MVISAPAMAVPERLSHQPEPESVGSSYYSVHAEPLGEEEGLGPKFREWFKKRWEQWKEQRAENRAAANRPTFEDNLKAVFPEKVQTLIDRSLILAIQQVVNERYQAVIAEMAIDIKRKYGAYMDVSQRTDIFSRYAADELTKRIFQSSYQAILERAYAIAKGNLITWSQQAAKTSPQFFTSEYKLYELGIGKVEEALHIMNSPEKRQQAASVVLGIIRTTVTNNLHQPSGPKSNSRAVVSTEPVDEETKSKNADKSASKGKSGKIPGSRVNVIVDMSQDGTTKVSDVKSQSNSNVNDALAGINVEIPPIDVDEVIKNNPETLKYTLRKPVAAATHFVTQLALFNVPLFFVTAAMVGLDSAKNPLAFDQLKQSVTDPAGTLGFGLFMMTNHKVAIGLKSMMMNPDLRPFATSLGMAAGMLAQSLFVDLWNDRDMRGCAKSMYDPKPENSESCNKFWNNWIVTNKIAKYTPAIMGLLSTAFWSGFVTKYGPKAVSKASSGVVAAEQRLAALMKEAVAEDPFFAQTKQAAVNVSNSAQRVAGTVANSAQRLAGKVGETGAKVSSAVLERAKRKEKLAHLISMAQQNLELARAELDAAKKHAAEFKQVVGEGWAAAKGKMNVRIAGIWAVSKEAFASKVELAKFLAGMQKLKFFVNASLVTFGTNLVFIALDPFVAEPLREGIGRFELTSHNIKQEIEDATVLDNFAEMVSAYFSHKVQLPDAKDFKTLPDVFNAYNQSLNFLLTQNEKKKAFQSLNINNCYVSQKNSEEQTTGESDDLEAQAAERSSSESTWMPGFLTRALKPVLGGVSDMVNAHRESSDFVKLYLLNQGLYFLNPSCVVESDFGIWLDKYAETEKAWRTVALAQVSTSSTVWGETVSNFVTNFNTTKNFYEFIAFLIHDYRNEKKSGKADLPHEDLQRDALIAGVKSLSDVGLRSEWNEQQEGRFETLFPDEIEDFETPEYADFMVASMACGPDARQPVSFMQNVKSMSWLPWESVSRLFPSVFSTWQTITPNSAIVETYPGTQFKYIPPRITNVDPKFVCDDSYWMAAATHGRGAYVNPEPAIYNRKLEIPAEALKMAEFARTIKYENLLEFLFENARESIITTEAKRDHFRDWFNNTSVNAVYDRTHGVWPVVKKNYENLMKHHFFPALNESTMETPCPNGGGLHCALTDDVYVRANGVLYSGINEVYTYIRTLRKVLKKHLELQTSPLTKNEGLGNFINGEFERRARAIIFAILDKNTIRGEESFNYSEVIEKVKDLEQSIFLILGNDVDPAIKVNDVVEKMKPEHLQTKETLDEAIDTLSPIKDNSSPLDGLTSHEKESILRAVAVLNLTQKVFEKMTSVVAELESYKKFSQISFKEAELPKAGQQLFQGGSFNPALKGQGN
jgi:hypothetical protein